MPSKASFPADQVPRSPNGPFLAFAAAAAAAAAAGAAQGSMGSMGSPESEVMSPIDARVRDPAKGKAPLKSPSGNPSNPASLANFAKPVQILASPARKRTREEQVNMNFPGMTFEDIAVELLVRCKDLVPKMETYLCSKACLPHSKTFVIKIVDQYNMAMKWIVMAQPRGYRTDYVAMAANTAYVGATISLGFLEECPEDAMAELLAGESDPIHKLCDALTYLAERRSGKNLMSPPSYLSVARVPLGSMGSGSLGASLGTMGTSTRNAIREIEARPEVPEPKPAARALVAVKREPSDPSDPSDPSEPRGTKRTREEFQAIARAQMDALKAQVMGRAAPVMAARAAETVAARGQPEGPARLEGEGGRGNYSKNLAHLSRGRGGDGASSAESEGDS